MYSPPWSLTRFFLRSMTEKVPSCRKKNGQQLFQVEDEESDG